jgi:nicotinamide phosphoribosyltransferase
VNHNIILNADSYKASQHLQRPAGLEYLYSYIESRGGEYEETVFFGLQMFLKEYLSKPITKGDIDEGEDFWVAHGEPFYRAGWEHILTKHGGYLPLEIKAVPEGTILPTKNVLVTNVNTDPETAWLESYLETALLRAVWYPTTVATRSLACKRIIKEFLDKTSDDTKGQLPFKLHDFGARGVSSFESAAIGGAAHLVNFMGTDTMSGIIAARRYYGEPMAGFSIPAAEHSTITAWGREGEAAAYANMLDQFAQPGKLLAVVSDSYDLFNAVSNIWGGSLRQRVLDSGATVVIRPDSGNPPDIVLETVQRLDAAFGSSENRKGYKVLNNAVRVIQGDGINVASLREILTKLTNAGYSADNVAFGMGGGLLQQLDRDTLKFAMKASAARINGEWRDVYKDPVTDPGKRSKRGRLVLVKEEGVYQTETMSPTNAFRDHLDMVFRDGILVKDQTFKKIRERAAI